MLEPRAVLFDLISARSAWLGQRQAVLGQNVAQADTPGFRPRDLEPVSFSALLRHAGGSPRQLEPVRTAPAHVAGQAAARGGFAAERAVPYEVTPSGNGVELPEQLEKMARIELDHRLTTGLYRSYVGMLRTALGVPQG
jgi:flagellar basal-body rod protein FlgB